MMFGFVFYLSLIDKDFNWLSFDAQHYHDIHLSNYSDFRIAFFPGFPMFWKILGGSPLFISVVNACLYAVSLTLLIEEFGKKTSSKWLWLLLPSAAFFFVPYSESLFFFGSSLLLIGLNRSNTSLLVVGVLLASFTRPVAFTFIPAFMGVWILFHKEKSIKRLIAWGGLASLTGLILAFFIQSLYDGQWFRFFRAQEEGWNNHWRIPEFPLKSWGGNFITSYDGMALWTGVLLGIFFLVRFYEFASRKAQLQLKPAEVFSLLFIVGTSLIVLLTRGGQLFSLNRFIFASAFLPLALQSIQIQKWNSIWRWIVIVSIIPFSLFLGSYLHIKGILHYALITAFIATVVISITQQKYPSLKKLAFVLLAVLQLYIGWHIAEGYWVG